jgi:hypothetical protein
MSEESSRGGSADERSDEELQREIEQAREQIDEILAGATGATGPTGPTGTTGPTRPTGATGPAMERARRGSGWESSAPGWGASGAAELYSLGRRTNDYLDQVDREQDIGLKRRYARALLWLLGGQLAIADVIFFVYAQVGVHWRLPPVVIDIWLGATLVEVVGIVLVVTRYLFPRRDLQS